MKIESIEAHNLKCPSFRHELGAVTVLVGENYSGKSARLEAIRLGLLGWCPGLPKTNAGIFSLSCGASMEVELKLSDGKKITRSFAQKGATISFSSVGELEIPDVLMDASTYLKKSDTERVKYVFSLVNISDKWSGETILRTIGETPIDCEPEIVEAVVLAKREIFERISKHDYNRHYADVSVQDWLESELADLRERVRNTNAALGRMEKFSQASVELRSNVNGPDAANVDRLLKEKAGQLQALREKQALNRERTDTARRNESMRNELTRRLAEPWEAGTLNALLKQIEELDPKVQGHKSNIADLTVKVAEAKGQLEAARAVERKIISEITALSRQHDLDVKAPACPHCGTKGKKFKDSIEEQFRERNEELVKSQAKTAKEIVASESAYELAGQAYKAAAVADQAAQQDRMILQSAKAEVNRLETLKRNRELWQQQLDSLKAVEGPTDQDTVELSKEIARIESEVLYLSDRQKRWIAATQDAKRLAEARAHRQASEAELIALKAVVKSVEVIQSAMVEDAFGQILADVNRFTDGILLTPLAYHDGEIGRWAGTVWIPHRSFSGTEQLISCAGISVALARQSPIRLVALDELGRLTTANKRRLVERLLALTADGFIDQVVAVDVDAGPYRDIEGVQLIEI